jgi:protease-4
MLARREMSPQHRAMAEWILDGINGEFLAALSSARGLSEERVREIIDACPSSPDAFVQAGLADGVLFSDQVEEEIGEGTKPKLVEESVYAKVDRESVGLGGGAKVAVVYASGTIAPGKSGSRSLFGVTAGADTLSKALDDAADDDQIRAIVFRVDSPGGSATASDQVWHSARAARASKPVVVSMGDTAASGGYYMSAAADRIIAEPTTLTGSIGVVLFKPNVSRLLGDFGITTDALTRGRYGRVFDLTKKLNEDELGLLQRQMQSTYDLFLARVSEGRNLPSTEIDKVGGGRVWTGRQALAHGLVDELGGLHEAVLAAAKQADIDDAARVELVFYPKEEGILERLSSLRAGTAQEWLRSAWTRELAQLGAHTLLGAGIHTFAPRVFSIR